MSVASDDHVPRAKRIDVRRHLTRHWRRWIFPALILPILVSSVLATFLNQAMQVAEMRPADQAQIVAVDLPPAVATALTQKPTAATAARIRLVTPPDGATEPLRILARKLAEDQKHEDHVASARAHMAGSPLLVFLPRSDTPADRCLLILNGSTPQHRAIKDRCSTSLASDAAAGELPKLQVVDVSSSTDRSLDAAAGPLVLLLGTITAIGVVLAFAGMRTNALKRQRIHALTSGQVSGWRPLLGVLASGAGPVVVPVLVATAAIALFCGIPGMDLTTWWLDTTNSPRLLLLLLVVPPLAAMLVSLCLLMRSAEPDTRPTWWAGWALVLATAGAALPALASDLRPWPGLDVIPCTGLLVALAAGLRPGPLPWTDLLISVGACLLVTALVLAAALRSWSRRPMPTLHPQRLPGGRDALLLFAGILGVAAIANLAPEPGFTIIFQLGGAALVFLVLWIRGYDRREVHLTAPPIRIWIGALLLIPADHLVWGLCEALFAGGLNALGVDPAFREAYVNGLKEDTAAFGPVGTVVYMDAFPGICEEIAFRTVLLVGLQRCLGTTAAVLLNALLFGVMHGSPHHFAGPFGGGLYALVCLRSGSVVPGAILHFSHNLVVSAFSWDVFKSPPDSAIAVFAVSVLLALPVASWLGWRLIRKNPPPPTSRDGPKAEEPMVAVQVGRQ
jgi:membrane protease YdiL (CAAX protease family)